MKISNILFKSFITEGLEDIKKYYPKISDKDFNSIISADPTYNGGDNAGLYGKWLLKLYSTNNLKLEDLYKATHYLTLFHTHKRQLDPSEKDIGKFRTLPELWSVVQKYETVIPQKSNREIKKDIKKEIERVYEDDTWLVIVPKTMKASQYYGANTKWCTAAKDENNAFDDYNDMDNLYININKKTGKKYQFHFYSGQFMDELDSPLDDNSFLSEGLKQWYFDNKILGWLPPFYTDVHTYTYGHDFGSPRVFFEIDLGEMCQSLFDYCYNEESYIILNKNMNNKPFLTGQFFNQILRGFNTNSEYVQLLSDFIHIFEDKLKSGLKEDDVYDLIIDNEDIKTKIREYIRDNVFDKAIAIMQKQIPMFDYNDVEENYGYLWQYDLDLGDYREKCADYWFSGNEFPFAIDEEDNPNTGYHNNQSYWYLYIESKFNHEEIATDVLALSKEVCKNLYSIIYNVIVSGGKNQLSFNYNESLNEEKAVVTNKTDSEIELNNSTVLHKNVVNQFFGDTVFNNLQVGQEIEIGDYHKPTSETIKDYKLNDNFWQWFGNSKVVDEEGKPIICYHGGPTAIKVFDRRYSGFNTSNNETKVFFFTSDEGVAEDYSVEAQARIGDSNAWNSGLEMDYGYDDYMEQIRDMARRNVHTNPCFISMENPIIWDNNYNAYSYKLIYTLTSIAQGNWDYNSDFWDSIVEEEILERYTTTNEDGDTDYSELENMTFDGVIIKNIHDSISNEGSSNVFTTEYLVWNPNQIKSVYNKGIWSSESSNNINESVIKRVDGDVEGYYTYNENEFVNIIENKFPEKDIRVLYDIDRHLYMFGSTYSTIHSNLILFMILTTNVYDNVPEIKDNRYADDEYLDKIIQRKLNLSSFKIFRNNENDNDNEFLRFLSNTPDNATDNYGTGYACKINDTMWAICRNDELEKAIRVPLLNNKKWIRLTNILNNINESVTPKLNDNFWKWFDGSKIVDKKGNPLVCYHETDVDFNSFDISKQSHASNLGYGFYFSSEPFWSKLNVDMKYKKECYLRIKNPFDATKRYTIEEVKFLFDNEVYNDIIKNSKLKGKYTLHNLFCDAIEYLFYDSEKYNGIDDKQWYKMIYNNFQKAGYDGIKRRNHEYGMYEYVVFNPNQIKSVDNNGNWSSEVDNINESKEIKTNDNFKKWFGNSKVVDKKGNPLVVYHGSPVDFNEFDKSKQKKLLKYGQGFYFTSNKQRANLYGEPKGFYLRINNPITKDTSLYFNLIEKISTELGYIENPKTIKDNIKNEKIIASSHTKANKIMIEKGYDGIILYDEYIVFKPNQIKSANNNGNWSTTSNNINETKDDVMENTNLTEDLKSTVLKRRRIPTFVNRTEEQTRKGLEKILNKTQRKVFFDYYDKGYSLDRLSKKYNIEPEKIKTFIVVLRRKILSYNPPINPNIDPKTGRFVSGSQPWNKGKKGYMGANKTSFTRDTIKQAEIGSPKQGNGHLVTATDERKPVVDKRSGKTYMHHKRESYPRWVLKQNGIEVPDDCVVWHKDGDYTNNDLSNLEVITRAESCRRTQRQKRQKLNKY